MSRWRSTPVACSIPHALLTTKGKVNIDRFMICIISQFASFMFDIANKLILRDSVTILQESKMARVYGIGRIFPILIPIPSQYMQRTIWITAYFSRGINLSLHIDSHLLCSLSISIRLLILYQSSRFVWASSGLSCQQSLAGLGLRHRRGTQHRAWLEIERAGSGLGERTDDWPTGYWQLTTRII